MHGECNVRCQNLWDDVAEYDMIWYDIIWYYMSNFHISRYGSGAVFCWGGGRNFGLANNFEFKLIKACWCTQKTKKGTRTKKGWVARLLSFLGGPKKVLQIALWVYLLIESDISKRPNWRCSCTQTMIVKVYWFWYSINIDSVLLMSFKILFVSSCWPRASSYSINVVLFKVPPAESKSNSISCKVILILVISCTSKNHLHHLSLLLGSICLP